MYSTKYCYLTSPPSFPIITKNMTANAANANANANTNPNAVDRKNAPRPRSHARHPSNSKTTFRNRIKNDPYFTAVSNTANSARFIPNTDEFFILSQKATTGELDKCYKRVSVLSYLQIANQDGIFRVSNKGAQRMIIEDDPLDFYPVNVGDITFLCDESLVTFKDNVLQVPSKSTERAFCEKVYAISKNASVQLVVKSDSTGMTSDVWLQMPKALSTNPAIVEEIDSLFSQG